MSHVITPSVIGVIVAIAITATLDANGLAMLSALPLLPLGGIFWYWERFTRRQMGLNWGQVWHWGLGALHPVVVLGAITLICLLAGVVDTADANWRTVGLNFLAGSSIGIVMVVLTEEGFFRGWLWASLTRAGHSKVSVLILSSVAFSLWHVSWATLDTDFDLPAGQIPVYLLNVALIGLIWGVMRWISESVLVAGLCHAVWNALVYPLFGIGGETGALGVTQKSIYGPEVGIVGLIASVVFLSTLWFWAVKRGHVSSGDTANEAD